MIVRIVPIVPVDLNNRDLKHQNGRHEDGVLEVHYLVQSCAERKKLSAISRRPHLDNAGHFHCFHVVQATSLPMPNVKNHLSGVQC